MKAAPEFSLSDQDGQTRSLKDYVGQYVVLYFYPKDNTPGCTKEACAFRDSRDLIAQLGNGVVIGISKDSPASHKKFADKYHLNFTLLSDPSGETIEAYGAWGPKKFMGREYIGINRNTYLIDPKGNVVKEYLGVDPVKHAPEIIADLKELQS